MPRITSKLAYTLLVFLVLAPRVAYIVLDGSYYHTGKAELERAAASLARSGMLGDVYAEGSGPSAHVAPLYPLLLGGVYRVFGDSTVAGRLVQELLAIAATALGIALLPAVARRAGLSEGAGWAAALLMAVLPLNLWVETSGSWEQPYAAAALLGLLMLFFRIRRERWERLGTAAAAGVVLGLAALLSPILLPAGVLMILAEVAAPGAARRRVLRGSVLVASAAALTLMPWTIRNYVALGGFIPLRSNFGLELAVGNHPEANGKTYVTFFEDPSNPFLSMHPFASAAERARLLERGEWAYMKSKQAGALRWMRSNPGRVLSLTLRRWQLFWWPSADSWGPASHARGLKAVAFTTIGLAALLQLTWLVVGRHDGAWLLVAAAIGPSLVYLLTHVDPRYRYPMFGLTTLLTCQFAASLYRVQRRADQAARQTRPA